MSLFTKYDEEIISFENRLNLLKKSQKSMDSRHFIIDAYQLKRDIIKRNYEIGSKIRKFRIKILWTRFLASLKIKKPKVNLGFLVEQKINLELLYPTKYWELNRLIKNSKDEVLNRFSDLERHVNSLIYIEKDVSKKTFLENLYYFSAIVIGSIPIASSLGFIFAFMYLNQINLTNYMMEVTADGGIWFFIPVIGAIFLLEWILPMCFIGIKSSENEGINYKTVKNSTSIDKYANNTILTLIFFISTSFSFLGFYLIFR